MVHSIITIDGTARASSPTPPAPNNQFISSVLPSINGTFEVNQTVTADPGAWNAQPTSITYQWLRSGTPINGENGPSYTLTLSDVGSNTISVRTTPTLSGWTGGTHISSPITVTDTPEVIGTPDEGLWFAKSNATATRKVYCHWFRYPLGFSNSTPPNTYENSYLALNGEGGAHVSYGGLLRDRPMTQDLLYTDGAGDHAMPFGGSQSWSVQGQRADIEEAIAIGIDGFFHDILGGSGQNWNYALDNFAAAAYYPGFDLIPMLDCNGGIGQTNNAATIAERLRILLAYDCVPVINGKKVLATYRSENIGGSSVTNKPAFWTQIQNALLSTYGINVTFWHCFGTPPSSQSALAAYTNTTAVGRWGWGGADPAIINAASTSWATYGRNLGMKVFPSIFNQWVRAKYGEFDEAMNTRAMQAAWDKANSLCTSTDFVQITTWNDYSEGHQIAPTKARGWLNWAYTAWNIQKFKYGVAPQILRDAVIISHRNQLSSTTITGGQTLMMTQRSNSNRSSFRQHVEVVTFLTAADTVTVTIGSSTHTYTAQAGEYVASFPMQTGSVTVTTGRGVTLPSPITIRSITGNQDRNYMGTYNIRQSSAQGDPTPAS